MGPQVSTSLTLMPAQLPSHFQLLERPSLGLLFLRIKLKLNLDKNKIKTNTNITIQNKETDNGISGFQIIMSTQAKAVESNIILPDYYCNHYYYEGFHQELLKKYHVITNSTYTNPTIAIKYYYYCTQNGISSV